jgi:hypothetical protein
MYITSTSGYSTKPCTAQITKHKNRLKVYHSKKSQVFLNDEDEFEIELFNPKTSPVLAKISLNGKRISERGIILYPGQRIFLERFLDSSEKFKFSTYKVNNSKEAKEAIVNNGLVKVEFYDEYNTFSTSGTITWTTNSTPNYFSNYNLTGSNFNTVTSTYYNASLTSTTNSIAGSLNIGEDLTRSLNKRADAVETGRIEKGSESDQNFSNANGNFNSWTCNVVEYQILPVNDKPVEVSEIRNYCTRCGTRNKRDWKFCPTCGQKF